MDSATSIVLTVLVFVLAAWLTPRLIAAVAASDEMRFRLDFWDIPVFAAGLAVAWALALALPLDAFVAGVAGVAGGLGMLRLRRTLTSRPESFKYEHLPSVPVRTLKATVLIGIGIALALFGISAGAFVVMILVTTDAVLPNALFVLVPAAMLSSGAWLIWYARRIRTPT